MNKYYLTLNGAAAGPYTLGQLRNMWAAGQVTLETPVCLEGAAGWSTLESMAGVLEDGPESVASSAEMGVARASAPTVREAARSGKGRGVYIVLGLLLGGLGAHNFYAGRYAVGAAQAVLTVVVAAVTLALDMAPAALLLVPIWVVLEICTVEVDGEGRKMKL